MKSDCVAVAASSLDELAAPAARLRHLTPWAGSMRVTLAFLHIGPPARLVVNRSITLQVRASRYSKGMQLQKALEHIRTRTQHVESSSSLGRFRVLMLQIEYAKKIVCRYSRIFSASKKVIPESPTPVQIEYN